jgi:hypothetical protein
MIFSLIRFRRFQLSFSHFAELSPLFRWLFRVSLRDDDSQLSFRLLPFRFLHSLRYLRWQLSLLLLLMPAFH